MKSTLSPFRAAAVLAAAGAALLAAPGAFAQTTAPSFYFSVVNSTFSGGDPVFSVADDLTFTNLQLNETFANGFSQTILMPSLSTAETNPAVGGAETTSTFQTSSPLVSAVLTGSIGPGPAQTINLAADFSGTTTQAYVASNFSANLFGTAPAGPALGIFSLIGSNNSVTAVNIVPPAAVPEASTTVSLGLLLAFGVGALIVARRRTASAN